MITLRIDIQGLEQADRLAQHIIQHSKQAIQAQLVNLAENILAEAKQNLQNNESVMTWELAGSLKIFDVTENSIVFGSDKEYAAYVEYGRGPVEPVNKKVLHFKIDGKEVFTGYAGPAEPKPFLEPAVLRYLPEFQIMLAMDSRIVPTG